MESTPRERLRDVMARFATGVTVVSAREESTVHGMTVNSFVSVSLQPPLVLFCASPRSRTMAMVGRTGRFTVSVLSEAQEAISHRFANPATEQGGRFVELPDPQGPPVVPGCLAWLDCKVEQQWEAGDHIIVVGHVDAMDLASEEAPLIFYRSHYRRIAPFPGPEESWPR
ncbi:MAG: flavin reductase family protein [Candidatus Xenobia bacterium]